MELFPTGEGYYVCQKTLYLALKDKNVLPEPSSNSSREDSR
jgi:hypothetical protein